MTEKTEQITLTPKQRAEMALQEINVILDEYKCIVQAGIDPLRIEDGGLLCRPGWRIVPLNIPPEG